jgi:hypothetical protein
LGPVKPANRLGSHGETFSLSLIPCTKSNMRTIRLRAQALRPVLMSAKITREIKPSKAEAGRRMLCGPGEAAMGNTLAASLCARRTAQLPQPCDPCGSIPAAAPSSAPGAKQRRARLYIYIHRLCDVRLTAAFRGGLLP